jgi:hypothetical protein
MRPENFGTPVTPKVCPAAPPAVFVPFNGAPWRAGTVQILLGDDGAERGRLLIRDGASRRVLQAK